METKTIISVRAIKIEKLRVNVSEGYSLLSGWTIVRESDGAYLTFNGTHPYLPRGGRGACLAIQKSGLYKEGSKFVVL